MNLCLLVRHGDYNSAGLSEKGRSEIANTAQRIAPHVRDKSIVALSSPAPRASQSADILREQLGLNAIQTFDVLWADSSHRIQPDAAHACITRAGQDTEVVLVVTHLELVELLPSRLGAGRPNQEPYYGDCFAVDFYPNGNRLSRI